MERPSEFQPICRAIIEDILALRAAPLEKGDPVDLEYLQFEACLSPLRLALGVGDLGSAHDWIVTGLGNDAAHGVERTLEPGRLSRFAEAHSWWITANRASTTADWALAFYYYCRRRATLHDAARAALLPTLTMIGELPTTDGRAIEARCMIVNWASAYEPQIAVDLARPLLVLFNRSDLDVALRTRIAVLFATNDSGLSAWPPAYWAGWALAHGTLAPHEPFQLVWQHVKTVEEWDQVRAMALASAQAYAASLRPLVSPVAIARAIDQRSGILGPAFVKLTEFARSGDLLAVLARWYDVPPALALEGGVMFVSPNHHAGTAYLGARPQILEDDDPTRVSRLAEVTNEGLGIVITVQGEDAAPAVPEYPGRPRYALGNRFGEALRAAYRFDAVEDEVLHGRTAMVPFPGQPHPHQALMVEARGFTLPIAASLQRPASDRAPRRALIWAADNDMFSGFEADAVQQLLEGAGTGCERRSGNSASAEDFLAAYSDPSFDIIWLAGHGEIDHWNDGSARLIAGDDCIVGIDELVVRTPRAHGRRLLMLNICDGGVSAVNGGIPRLGLAPIRLSYETIKSRPHLRHRFAGQGTLSPRPRIKTDRPHRGQPIMKLLAAKYTNQTICNGATTHKMRSPAIPTAVAAIGIPHITAKRQTTAATMWRLPRS